MKRLIILMILALLPVLAKAGKDGSEPTYYGSGLCKYPQYQCIKIKGGQSWKKLFPDETQRDLVQRLNRTYNPLYEGQIIAVPQNLETVNLFDVSPFPLKISPSSDNQIIVDQEKLAWGAYDEQGQLIKWGPISSGSDQCSDNSSKTCRTLTGIFRVFSKEGENCVSNAFPAGKGGASMPYCMFFHKGFALHGSEDIPGYRASHGCVRMFIDDAKWLNHDFVKAANVKNNFAGTVVTIRPLYSADLFNKGIDQTIVSPAARHKKHRN
ncbi:L,D-transpeptidase [Legionella maceachernii]|uniref:Enhanced entry protein EnhA n=2 Tax=Legionella TaxID=445 RepID=A0A0W0WDV7_9GAMM|nr:enhanced entry protein EnhA [Legionella maceachernii]SJZ65973.1 Lipoprotein-anchoring transpeptidase ErfK/SrfK [Legionella maceachernii]SUP01935.1 L,D-transpeptidase catalytic domain [Legionella maceachernii]